MKTTKLPKPEWGKRWSTEELHAYVMERYPVVMDLLRQSEIAEACDHRAAEDGTWWCPACGEFLKDERGPTDRDDD